MGLLWQLLLPLENEDQDTAEEERIRAELSLSSFPSMPTLTDTLVFVAEAFVLILLLLVLLALLSGLARLRSGYLRRGSHLRFNRQHLDVFSITITYILVDAKMSSIHTYTHTHFPTLYKAIRRYTLS